jgi:hypothetical protein
MGARATPLLSRSPFCQPWQRGKKSSEPRAHSAHGAPPSWRDGIGRSARVPRVARPLTSVTASRLAPSHRLATQRPLPRSAPTSWSSSTSNRYRAASKLRSTKSSSSMAAARAAGEFFGTASSSSMAAARVASELHGPLSELPGCRAAADELPAGTVLLQASFSSEATGYRSHPVRQLDSADEQQWELFFSGPAMGAHCCCCWLVVDKCSVLPAGVALGCSPGPRPAAASLRASLTCVAGGHRRAPSPPGQGRAAK